MTEIKQWVYDNCLEGVERLKQDIIKDNEPDITDDF